MASLSTWRTWLPKKMKSLLLIFMAVGIIPRNSCEAGSILRARVVSMALAGVLAFWQILLLSNTSGKRLTKGHPTPRFLVHKLLCEPSFFKMSARIMRLKASWVDSLVLQLLWGSEARQDFSTFLTTLDSPIKNLTLQSRLNSPLTIKWQPQISYICLRFPLAL